MNQNSAYKVNTNLDPSIKWVVIREESLKTIREIENKLNAEKVPCKVNVAPGCSSGSCSITYVIMVPEYQVKIGLRTVENYFLTLYPELQKCKDLEEQGRCPACGFKNDPDATICADCELPFIVEY